MEIYDISIAQEVLARVNADDQPFGPLFLFGEWGLGQEETLEYIISSPECQKVSISLRKRQYLAGPMETISRAIMEHSSAGRHHQNVFQTNNQTEIEAFDKYFPPDLSCKENLLSKFVKLFQSAGYKILSIHGIQSYSLELIYFLQEFLTLCNINHVSVHIIIDLYDRFEHPNWYQSDFIQKIFSAQTGYMLNSEYFTFKVWSDERLQKLLDDVLQANRIIDITLEKKLFNLANYNPKKLLYWLEVLKAKQCIYRLDAHSPWICRDFEIFDVQNAISEHVSAQYTRLGDIHKKTLQQAAVIGEVFELDLMFKSFKINSIYEHIKSIESKTQLIRELSRELYSFRASVIHQSILQTVSDSDHITWAQTLAEFLIQQWLGSEDSFDPYLNAYHTYYVGTYLFTAKDYTYALEWIQRSIPHLIQIQHYDDALDALAMERQILGMLHRSTSGEHHFNLAECYRSKFDNKRACEEYRNALSYKNLPHRRLTKYFYAVTLYNSGFMDSPREIFKELAEIEDDDKGEFDNISIMALAMFAAVEETTGNPLHSYYFNQALSRAHAVKNRLYYNLLRKSSMAKADEESLILMRQAEKYYRDQKNRKELAFTLHNIGTCLLFSGDPDESLACLEESLEILNGFNSIGTVLAKNSLSIHACLYQGKFHDEYHKFRHLMLPSLEPFFKIVLSYNQATCLRHMKKFDECEKLLHIIENTFTEGDARQFLYQIGYLPLHWAFLYRERGQLQEALASATGYFRDKEPSGHYRDIIAISLIRELCDSLNKPYPSIAGNKIRATSNTSQRLMANNGLYSRLFFWED